MPKVEKQSVDFETEGWKVAGIERKDAAEVLRIEDKLNYGGTPSDESVVRYLEHIKAKGLKVMFYPMPFVDLVGKPWRGRISGLTGDGVRNFFNGENGYNKFILHYANLVKDYADAFLIGSEMEDLSRFKDENGEYVAVNEFVKLAERVKEIVRDKVKVSYAANWGEYHSVGGDYYMDKLWSSKAIDFIGIDAYFPLTESNTSQYNVKKLIKGWDSGELYDFYYEDGKKIPLSKEYAIKNIEHWWSNKHYNKDGTETSWEPKMKKIWFTEYGFASVSCATNEPNVFVDDSTSESRLPKYSNGKIDLLAQRSGIQATEMRWKNSEMVERKFLWTWDARPYPTWPQLDKIWADGKMWERGHWLNGKAGIMELRSVVRDICVKVGIPNDMIDVDNLHGIVHGMVIDQTYSARNILEDLEKVYNFTSSECNGKLVFTSKSVREIKELSYDELLCEHKLDEVDDGFESSPLTIEVINSEPQSISLSYIGQNFEIEKYEFSNDESDYKNTIEIALPIVMSQNDAKTVAQNILCDVENSNTNYDFTIAIHTLFRSDDEMWIKPGDLLKINYRGDDLIMTVKILDIKDDNTVRVTCCKDSGTVSNDIRLSSDVFAQDDKLHEFIPQSAFEVMRIPNSNIVAIVASGLNKRWYGCQVTYDMFCEDKVVASDSILIDQPTIIGDVISFDGLIKKDYFTLDNHSRLVVKLHHGQLFSLTKDKLFTSDKNMILVGDEIMKFSSAKLQPDGTYVISGLLRGLYGTKTEKFDRFVFLDRQNAKVVELEKGVDKIDLKVKTFFDKKRVTGSKELQQKLFSVGNELIPPVNLVVKNNEVHWTPRIISDDLFVEKLNHGFYVKFIGDNGLILSKLHTTDNHCFIPTELRDRKFNVMIAVFIDNQIKSDFAYLEI